MNQGGVERGHTEQGRTEQRRTEQRRVLVTGAGGVVGSALTSGFADLGWDVIGLDRVFDKGWGDHGIRRVTAELAEGVPPDVPGVDLVVHAAWVTTDPETLGVTPAEYVALNTRPLRAMLDYASRTAPAGFVFVSSSGVFAPTDGAADATEGLTDAHHPTGTSPYAAAKREGETLVRGALGFGASGSGSLGTSFHVVRLGYLYGPGEVTRPSRPAVSLVAGWLAAAREGRPLAVRSDDPLRDWTFTSDLAAALERFVDGPSADHSAGQPIHLASPHVCRDSVFASLIAAEFPGAQFVTVPAGRSVKPPMIPSDIPALRGFDWTEPSAGLRALLAGGVAA